jgi:hypothetical protein
MPGVERPHIIVCIYAGCREISSFGSRIINLYENKSWGNRLRVLKEKRKKKDKRKKTKGKRQKKKDKRKRQKNKDKKTKTKKKNKEKNEVFFKSKESVRSKEKRNEVRHRTEVEDAWYGIKSFITIRKKAH